MLPLLVAIISYFYYLSNVLVLPVMPSATPSPIELSVLGSSQSGEIAIVKRVVDGDTVELDNGQKVRLIGIDTPETVDPRRGVQCFGKEASAKTKELLLSQSVTLVKDVSETDRYDRLLRYIYVGDQFINLYLVEQGYAKASSYPPDVKYQALFSQAEVQARLNNLGLWKACPSI